MTLKPVDTAYLLRRWSRRSGITISKLVITIMDRSDKIRTFGTNSVNTDPSHSSNRRLFNNSKMKTCIISKSRWMSLIMRSYKKQHIMAKCCRQYHGALTRVIQNIGTTITSKACIGRKERSRVQNQITTKDTNGQIHKMSNTT